MSAVPARAKTVAASAGGVLAAFLGPLCCAGPVLFATLGVGVGAGLAARFAPLRSLFGVLMLASFTLAYRRAYPRPGGATPGADTGVDSAAGAPLACVAPGSRRRDRLLFWSAAVVALALWTSPLWARLLA